MKHGKITPVGLTASNYVITDGSKGLASQAGIPRADIANTGGATGDLLVGSGTSLNRLGIGSSGQVLTVSGGTAAWVSPSGAYNAVDVATTHWYKLDESTGNFANSISGNANPLSPSSASSFLYQDPGIFSRGTTGVRCLANAGTNNDSLNATGLTTSLASGCTIECIVGPLDLVAYFSGQTIVEVSNTTRSNGLIQIVYDTASSPGQLRASLYQGGPVISSTSTYKPGGRVHLAAVYSDSTKQVTLWVNGIAMTASSALDITAVQMNLVTVGNNTSGGGAYRGLIADVRVTPAQLTSTYFLAATKAMGAL